MDQNDSLIKAASDGDLEEVISALNNGADVNYRNEPYLQDHWTALHWSSHNGHTEIVQSLLQHKADPNICNKDLWTALHWASQNSHSEIVQLLLQSNADPNICNKDQETALHRATSNDHSEIVQVLLQYQTDPNISNKEQWTALHCASSNNYTEIVQLLLQSNADPNICNKEQWTALHCASGNGHSEVVQLLLQYNANPNICNEEQCTPLHYASSNNYTEIVQLLLQSNADPDICNKEQWTALHCASRNGHSEVVQLLLQYNANPNIFNECTALYVATHNGHTEIVQLLLKFNADPNICTKEQWTALYLASNNGNTEIVQLLLQYNADPNICTKDQMTALYTASYYGYAEIVESLLQYKADPNICEKKDQETAIYWASHNSHTEIVQLLLHYNADPNICNKDMMTALHWASNNGCTEIVQLLLEYNANPNICNKDQMTALYAASYYGYTEIVQLLLQYKAYPNICTKDQMTALYTASYHGYAEIVESLLQYKADPNICEKKDQETAIYCASHNSHTEIVQLLLQYNADPNICNKDQMTVLHFASSNGHTEIVQLLLQYNTDPNICSKDGDTALHIACKQGHTNIIQSLLSQGGDTTITNNDGNTPLDECQDNIKDEIASLFSKYNPKRVLEDVSKWNIEYLNEEQVFEKPEYGVKFVIPPSSVEIGHEVKTEVKVVAPEESDIILPPDVELVSCFYKIETTGKFSRPIELHLQHNIELRSQEESQQLAFVRAKGPPPYKFELLSTESEQVFRPYNNSGVLGISDFSFVAVVMKGIKSALFRQPSCSYVLTVFLKEMMKFCWEIQAVVTKNLGPFLERVNTEKRFETWKRIDQVAIVDPDINEVTIANECYDIKPMMNPFQVSRKLIDQCQPDTALPYLKFKVSLIDKKELADLELTFNGISEQMSMVIASYDLQQQQEKTTHSTSNTSTTIPTPNMVTFTTIPTTASMSTSTSNPPNIHMQSSYPLGISDELLRKQPKKNHLTRVLHDIKYMWNTIGEQLEVRYGDIKSAEYNVAYDHTTKLSEVLQVWIDKRTCEVSWRMIITVIKEPPVENKVVAEKIYKFLVRPDIRNEYISSDQPGQVITTFNSPPPIPPKPAGIKDCPVFATTSSPSAPKPAKNKDHLSDIPPPNTPKYAEKIVEVDEMELEAPLQSTNPIGFAAHRLHKQAKQWEEKDNDMILATKRMARLMMQISKFAQDEDSDVNSKGDFIETANLIVKDSKEVAEIATKVAKLCTDTQLKNALSLVIVNISTCATQLKINVGVHARRGDDPKEDKETTEILTINAENLMNAVSEVINVTESAIIAVPPESHAQLTGLTSWVKRSAETLPSDIQLSTTCQSDHSFDSPASISKKPANEIDDDKNPAGTSTNNEETTSVVSEKLSIEKTGDDKKPAGTSSNNEEITSIALEKPSMEKTDDDKNPAGTSSNNEETTSIALEKPSMEKTDDDKNPAGTSTNNEETTSIALEKPSMEKTDDDKNPAGTSTNNEVTTSVASEKLSMEKTGKNDSLSYWPLLLLGAIFVVVLAYFIYKLN